MQARTEEELKEANRKYAEPDRMVKKSCRRDIKDWPIGVEPQEAANRGDSKTLYRIVSELIGALNISNTPIKDRSREPLMMVEEQDERSPINPRGTYNFENEEEPLDELDVNTGDISIKETGTAVRGLQNGKAPGPDEITTDLLNSGTRMLAGHLTRLFIDC
ncbi:hypothetical protein ANCDUO_07954 [Ancylostoma duodenale]|uniref:Reverse transcriptase domain-containing protein n=1 Tax=Ancylostoma duodenale TaxID=51022 RepID=A0A0C2GRP5_9BILA|nr:hypothetical protein ANCDUO_07954 [Ancylostoma duodenale]